MFGEEAVERLSDDGGRGPAEQPLRRRPPADDPTFGVGREDGVVGRLEDRVEQRLGRHLLVGLLGCGHRMVTRGVRPGGRAAQNQRRRRRLGRAGPAAAFARGRRRSPRPRPGGPRRVPPGPACSRRQNRFSVHFCAPRGTNWGRETKTVPRKCPPGPPRPPRAGGWPPTGRLSPAWPGENARPGRRDHPGRAAGHPRAVSRPPGPEKTPARAAATTAGGPATTHRAAYGPPRRSGSRPGGWRTGAGATSAGISRVAGSSPSRN